MTSLALALLLAQLAQPAPGGLAYPLGADLVAVTGDLVDGSVADLAEHVAPLARLRARHGVFFVTGNHEYYSGAHAWMAEVERLGIRVLTNEHVVIEHGPSRLVLAGVTLVTMKKSAVAPIE